MLFLSTAKALTKEPTFIPPIIDSYFKVVAFHLTTYFEVTGFVIPAPVKLPPIYILLLLSEVIQLPTAVLKPLSIAVQDVPVPLYFATPT